MPEKRATFGLKRDHYLPQTNQPLSQNATTTPAGILVCARGGKYPFRVLEDERDSVYQVPSGERIRPNSLKNNQQFQSVRSLAKYSLPNFENRRPFHHRSRPRMPRRRMVRLRFRLGVMLRNLRYKLSVFRNMIALYGMGSGLPSLFNGRSVAMTRCLF